MRIAASKGFLLAGVKRDCRLLSVLGLRIQHDGSSSEVYEEPRPRPPKMAYRLLPVLNVLRISRLKLPKTDPGTFSNRLVLVHFVTGGNTCQCWRA